MIAVIGGIAPFNGKFIKIDHPNNKLLMSTNGGYEIRVFYLIVT